MRGMDLKVNAVDGMTLALALAQMVKMVPVS